MAYDISRAEFQQMQEAAIAKAKEMQKKAKLCPPEKRKKVEEPLPSITKTTIATAQQIPLQAKPEIQPVQQWNNHSFFKESVPQKEPAPAPDVNQNHMQQPNRMIRTDFQRPMETGRTQAKQGGFGRIPNQPPTQKPLANPRTYPSGYEPLPSPQEIFGQRGKWTQTPRDGQPVCNDSCQFKKIKDMHDNFSEQYNKNPNEEDGKNDVMLLLSLIMLLSSDGADQRLLFALLYIMM